MKTDHYLSNSVDSTIEKNTTEKENSALEKNSSILLEKGSIFCNFASLWIANKLRYGTKRNKDTPR